MLYKGARVIDFVVDANSHTIKDPREQHSHSFININKIVIHKLTSPNKQHRLLKPL